MRGQRHIELIFERQAGVAERSQPLAAGVGEKAIDHRLKIGRYRSVHERVRPRPSLNEARLIAALLAGGDDAALCHASALVRFKVLASVVTIKAFAARHRGERGTPAIRRVAGEPHTRSGHERKFRRFLSENELPPPMSNHPIGPCCADFYWPQYELVIEFDEDGHKTELAFEEDPARDRYFVGLGLRVMRVTEQALRDESVLRQEVRRAARIVR